MALEPLIPAPAREDESVAAFFRRRFGAATVGLIAEPLLGGIHAGDVEQLSMRVGVSAADRRRRRQRGGIARNLGSVPRSADGGMFRALRGGMGELVDALAGALPAGAVRTQLRGDGNRATRIGWTVSAGGDRSTRRP